MTAAAFQATFTDWRLVKGRKVIQIVFEVPIEQADQAYQVLGGMPDPGQSVWCAVARLQQESEVMPNNTVAHRHANHKTGPALAPEQPARAPRLFTSLPLPQQAALLCADPVFWAFLSEDLDEECHDEEAAAILLRQILGVVSRRDIKPDTPAGKFFLDKREQFIAWKLVAA